MRRLVPWAAAVACLAIAGCRSSGTTQQTTSTTSRASRGAASASATSPAQTSPTVPAGGAAEGEERTLPGGLKVLDLKVGDGKMAEKGMTVRVHYTGWLADGTKFDSSRDRGEPLPFQIGADPPMVIRGWDEGVAGMRVGGKRKLTIPPDMAYGEAGFRDVIPPNATLVFEVELVDAK